MSIERHFLGWSAPCLPAAARWLFDRFPAAGGELDLSGVIVALPVSRAGRRLEELLVESAEHCGLRLVPPRLVTVGALPETLAGAGGPMAPPTERMLAWTGALVELHRDALRTIIADPPDPEDLPAWVALAERLDALHTELAGHWLDFQQIAQRGNDLAGDLDFTAAEGERWQALASVQAGYRQQLDRRGLADPQDARWNAVDAARIEPPEALVLLAAVELNPLQRKCVEAVAERAVTLVHAPPDQAEAFDQMGALHPEAWQSVRISLADDQIEIADRPADQAAAALGAIERFGGRYAADQITLGVCDEQVGPHLAQQLPAAGLDVRDAAGTPVDRTRPLRLLRAAADWLETRRFAEFATLLRHTDVERWLEQNLGTERTEDAHAAEPSGAEEDIGAAVEDWLSLLDRYYNDTLHRELTGRWLGEPGRARRMDRLYRGIQWMLGELAGEPRPLPRWAEPTAGFLATVYHRPLRRDRETDRLVLEACDRAREALVELRGVCEAEAPTVTASQAIRLALRRLEGSQSVPPEPRRGAIEMLGPLELHLDDAPALLVTGFNEGKLPSSVSVDPFLPDRLRGRLGLTSNTSRHARDAYALEATLRSRSDVRLIAGRRNTDGDPLTPSRLMFACDPDEAPHRVRCFSGEPEGGASGMGGLLGRWKPRERSEFPVPPEPQPPAEPVRSMPVTAFRTYLHCPYRFYLRHVLKLGAVDDEVEELDGGAFGDLAHDVLRAFGESDVAHETQADRITDALEQMLDERARRRFGTDPPPAVRVQVEQLRHRLRLLAGWQADWAAQGWRIVETERAVGAGEASLNVDGEPMGLTGRIDRIDVRESDGAIAVFDYKTGDKVDPPDKAHRKQGEWVDLQLPLYRHLLSALGYEAADGCLLLGYIRLPRAETEVGGAIAEDWGANLLADADEAAAEVIRHVRQNIFWPPSEGSGPFDEFAAICGVGQLIDEPTATEQAG